MTAENKMQIYRVEKKKWINPQKIIALKDTEENGKTFILTTETYTHFAQAPS